METILDRGSHEYGEQNLRSEACNARARCVAMWRSILGSTSKSAAAYGSIATCVCEPVCVCVCVCVRPCVRVSVCVRLRVSTCVCAPPRVRVCVSVCMLA